MVGPQALRSTFSIAAYDPDTQSWGVAAQSKYLAVGSVVPWAWAGVGAVATQARVNVGYGPDSLELLAKNLAPEAVLEQLTTADPGRVWRQIGIVDRHGHAATYTGAQCFPWAGARTGEGYTCQGNMLASAGVLDALAETFEQARDRGSDGLAEWLLVALSAAQSAGGDRRGQESASLLVVQEQGGPEGLNDRATDLRIDDHPAPITELHRLLALHRGLSAPHDRLPRISLLMATRRQTVEMLRLLGYLPDTGLNPTEVPGPELLQALARYAADEELPEYVDVPAQKFAPALLNFLRLRAYTPPATERPAGRPPLRQRRPQQQ